METNNVSRWQLRAPATKKPSTQLPDGGRLREYRSAGLGGSQSEAFHDLDRP
jgi:hypothetical protein